MFNPNFCPHFHFNTCHKSLHKHIFSTFEMNSRLNWLTIMLIFHLKTSFTLQSIEFSSIQWKLTHWMMFRVYITGKCWHRNSNWMVGWFVFIQSKRSYTCSIAENIFILMCILYADEVMSWTKNESIKSFWWSFTIHMCAFNVCTWEQPYQNLQNVYSSSQFICHRDFEPSFLCLFNIKYQCLPDQCFAQWDLCANLIPFRNNENPNAFSLFTC